MFSDLIDDVEEAEVDVSLDQIADSENNDTLDFSDMGILSDDTSTMSEEEIAEDVSSSENDEVFDDVSVGDNEAYSVNSGVDIDVNFDDSLNERVTDNSYLNAIDIANGYNSVEAPNFVEWYSDVAQGQCFEITKNSASQIIEGTNDCKIIHLDIGLSSYGWHIRFADGTIMSVPDVREYQLRNGKLPDDSGVIVFGGTQFEFSHIEKITVYQSVRYFSYR